MQFSKGHREQMIRTPTPQDLILIQKLRGVVLPPEEALINSYSPLRVALLSSLNPFRLDSYRAITYILSHRWQGEQLLGVAQVQENLRRATAQVVYLAPNKGWEDPSLWPKWLESICRKTGERGIRRLLACLPVEDTRLSAFQQAGFRIYAHEEIFRLTNPPSEPRTEEGFRPRRADDAWGLARLYEAITPPVAQQAEGLSQTGEDKAICAPIASHGTRGYVLEIKQEILGYAEVRYGGRGIWVRFLLHPQAGDMAETLVQGVLSHLPAQRVYCSLPDYQGGLRSALQSVGFEPLGQQALLVKYTAVFARSAVAELIPSLEKGAKMIAPVARAKGNCP